jgi:hypothetical protein
MNTIESIVERGRAMRQFCDRVRSRGGFALTEEVEDLPALRVQFLIARSIARGRTRARCGR